MANELSVMGFRGGYHGSTFATHSVSSCGQSKAGFPSYNWPISSFPKIKYPMNRFEAENKAEEERCLEEAEKTINQRKNAGTPVGAMIIEPISSINHEMATPYFYRQLRKLALDNGIPFIVDETNTGVGATGRMWAHEHWSLS
jgi:4-aminobutyrate aminotransferase/(S)-3-amino-2-methylpropionate transaminase